MNDAASRMHARQRWSRWIQFSYVTAAPLLAYALVLALYHRYQYEWDFCVLAFAIAAVVPIWVFLTPLVLKSLALASLSAAVVAVGWWGAGYVASVTSFAESGLHQVAPAFLAILPGAAFALSALIGGVGTLVDSVRRRRGAPSENP